MNDALDQQKADAFVQRMLDIVNHGSLAIMISIGHRTGLFDTLGRLPAATSAGIAEAAGLDERYVREWLGAMVTGRIVDHNPERDTYSLPAEHAAFLTRAASPNNLAVTAQWIPLLAGVEDQVVECFHKGGGVPYSAYPRFHQVMAEESAQTTVAGLTDAILPLVPGLTAELERGIDVLDVGCGSGQALLHLARTYRRSRFTGYDFSEEAIARGNAEAAREDLTNIALVRKDVATLDGSDRYHLVTAFDVIHDQRDPAAVLRGIARSLHPGGTFLMQDIHGSSHVHSNLEHPLGPFGYTVSCLHCMTVSLAQGGAGLGAMWGEEKALEMLAEAGFTRVEVTRLEHDLINSYYVARLD